MHNHGAAFSGRVFMTFLHFADPLCLSTINEKGDLSCKKNNRHCSIASLDLPKNIIAYTSSIHDKFPLPKGSSSFRFESKTGDFYQYLGHRERTGRSSSTAAIYRVLDRLVSVEGFSQKRLSALRRVFRFLNYHPILHITYYPRHNMRRIYDNLRDLSSNSETVNSTLDTSTLNYLERIIEAVSYTHLTLPTILLV